MTSVSSSMFAGLMSTMSMATVSTRRIYEADTQRTEAPVADLQVPKVDPKVIGRNVRLLIGIDRYGVYVVCMRVGVDLPWHSRGNLVLWCHAGQFEA